MVDGVGKETGVVQGEEVGLWGGSISVRWSCWCKIGGERVPERDVMVRRPRSERTQDSMDLAARRKAVAHSGRWAWRVRDAIFFFVV